MFFKPHPFHKFLCRSFIFGRKGSYFCFSWTSFFRYRLHILFLFFFHLKNSFVFFCYISFFKYPFLLFLSAFLLHPCCTFWMLWIILNFLKVCYWQGYVIGFSLKKKSKLNWILISIIVQNFYFLSVVSCF